MRRVRLPLLVVLLVTVVLASGERSSVTAGRQPVARLLELQDSGELRARFNRDHGVPRLILLLSPT